MVPCVTRRTLASHSSADNAFTLCSCPGPRDRKLLRNHVDLLLRVFGVHWFFSGSFPCTCSNELHPVRTVVAQCCPVFAHGPILDNFRVQGVRLPREMLERAALCKFFFTFHADKTFVVACWCHVHVQELIVTCSLRGFGFAVHHLTKTREPHSNLMENCLSVSIVCFVPVSCMHCVQLLSSTKCAVAGGLWFERLDA